MPGRKSKLDKVEQLLSIEEKNLNIALLKRELETKKIQAPNINIEKIEYLVTNNIKIIKHKSNFYKALIQYPKVKSLSTVELDENKKPIGEPRMVERKDFSSFILESDDMDSITDENAVIEIISPVLKVGKYKWRGLYNQIDYPIEFSMNDKKFKEDVIKEAIPFKTGSFIDCVLEISRKIDDLGNVYNSSYKVLTVLKHHEDGISSETPQGKKYRQKKEADKRQYNLFDPQNDNN